MSQDSKYKFAQQMFKSRTVKRFITFQLLICFCSSRPIVIHSNSLNRKHSRKPYKAQVLNTCSSKTEELTWR